MDGRDILFTVTDGGGKSATVTAKLKLSAFTLWNVAISDGIDADDPAIGVVISTSHVLGNDDEPIPDSHLRLDGSQVTLRLLENYGNGQYVQLNSSIVTVNNGLATWRAIADRHVIGHKYFVTAQIGQTNDPSYQKKTSQLIDIVAGVPAWIEPDIDYNGGAILDASGISHRYLRFKIRDQWGNPVAAGTPFNVKIDGPVEWESTGETIQIGSTAYAVVNVRDTGSSGQFPVTIESGSATVQSTVTIRPIYVHVTTSDPIVSLAGEAGVEVNVFVQNADAVPIAGVKLNWLATKGNLTQTPAYTDSQGHAHAILDLAGQSELIGKSLIAVRAAETTSSAAVTIQAPDAGSFVYTELEHRLLASTTAATSSVGTLGPNGTLIPTTVYGSTNGKVKGGTPGATVRIYLQGPARDYFTINGTLKFADVVYDAAGVATFTITSTGPLPPELQSTVSAMQVVPVPYHYLLGLLGIDEVPPGWETARQLGNYKFANHRVAVTSEQKAAALTAGIDATGSFLWGALAGGDSPAEIAGDISMSMIPGLGVYADVRDFVTNLARVIPGGESPDWTTMSLSVFGMVTEFLPPFDVMVDFAKNAHKLTDLAGPLCTAFAAMVLKKGRQILEREVTEFSGHLLKVIATDPEMAQFAMRMSGKADELPSLHELNDLSRFMLTVGETTRARNILEAVAHAGGDKLASNQMVKLSQVLTPTMAQTLTQSDRWGVLVKAMTAEGAMANKIGATALTRYTDALRMAPVGDARALKAIDDFELIADDLSAWGWLNGKGRLTKYDDQVQLAGAAFLKRQGQTLKGFDLAFDNGIVNGILMRGDVDVLTNAVAADVKKSAASAVKFIWNSDSENQLIKLSAEAIRRETPGSPLRRALMIPTVEKAKLSSADVAELARQGFELIDFAF